MQKIGSLIKEIRQQHHWSQAQMATALHVSKPTISLWEHNKRSIDPKVVQRYMRLFSLANAEQKRVLREWIR